MSSLVIVGCQWGDEGKGKLVDYLTSSADYVVRFQGGNNAGHTIVADGVTTKLSMIPSGILRANTKCLIATGCVIDARVIAKEIEQLMAAGRSVDPGRLVLDRDAHLILPYHNILDAAREQARAKDKIGTTGKGIGPAYEDRVTRCGVRLAELLQVDELKAKITKRVVEINKYLKEVLDYSEEVNLTEITEQVDQASKLLRPYIGNVSLIIDRARKAGERIVFEGAQGTLLDQMHGTIPYVTSSNTIVGAVTTGCGIGPQVIDQVLGVVKAYSTRVGEGPFPTELEDDTGKHLGSVGHEFGTVTGRARRCGWLDAFALKRAIRLNGIESMAITKLDVLSGLDKIKICINYYLDGEKLEDVPSLASEVARVEPQYIELPGWQEDISEVTKWRNLPMEAKVYLATIAEIVACPISMVSVGPDRKSTFFSSTAGELMSYTSNAAA